MQQMTSLKNRFLAAMPTLQDPHFIRAVAYIVEHNEEGAMGFIINKPLQMTLGDLLDHLKIPTDKPNVKAHPVLMGGPVAKDQGFILKLTTPVDETSKEMTIHISSSKDDLKTLAKGEGLEATLVSLGYTGWGPGQLEQELMQNSWLITPISPSIMFNMPFAERWRAAGALVGVDFSRMTGDIGHG